MGRPRLIRAAVLAAVATALVAGLAGGLWRAGVGLPPATPWAGAAIEAHAFLMVCAFMGSVIALERAVALKTVLAGAVPLASALAGVAMLAGWSEVARALAATAALGFVVVNAGVVRRQPAPHTALLLVAAVAWALGSSLHALRLASGAVLPSWFAFLVLTVAAERLEMTRLMPRRAAAAPALLVIVTGLGLGALASGAWLRAGGVVYGLALAALGVWLLCFDIARRTVRAAGLSRYMALCLLLGHVWLVVAGAAWAATALGLPWRDAALHALAIGFVFGMVFGHAPVILPALANVKLAFGPLFYLPLAVLHGSLALRLFAARVDPGWWPAGAASNVLALALFALTLAGAAWAWRRDRERPTPRSGRRKATEQVSKRKHT